MVRKENIENKRSILPYRLLVVEASLRNVFQVDVIRLKGKENEGLFFGIGSSESFFESTTKANHFC